MRRFFPFLALLAVALAVPASAQPASPLHLIPVFRPGPGQPRVRNVAAARAGSRTTRNPAATTGPTHPYQLPKPGEGAPRT